ncbi:hypothetical protein L6452_32995 [Arctium lappa]|uniref:Uncharacterized protein n=1 Tax=Arctium lappa TaxID=4217 RepID=A0ACB8Z591_ARCLA|nr:hypothetical protein L6452_32995 [Arctium lappa]
MDNPQGTLEHIITQMNMELTAARTHIDELANQNIRAAEAITSLRNQNNPAGSQNGFGPFNMSWSGPPLPNDPIPPFPGVPSQTMPTMHRHRRLFSTQQFLRRRHRLSCQPFIIMEIHQIPHNGMTFKRLGSFLGSNGARRAIQAIDVEYVDPASILGEMITIRNYDVKTTIEAYKRGLDESSSFNGDATNTLGEIILAVYAKGVNKSTKFNIVDCSSAYNVILGRPWIHDMKTVPSTFHQTMKFPTP